MTDIGYANPNLLWTADQLSARLDDPSVKVVDVRPGERFSMGHIPDARHYAIYAVNCDDTDEAPLNSFVRMWAFLLGSRGISFDDTIVLCGEITGMTSTRGFWFLEYLGHRNVHILDGGYTAWADAGLATTRDADVVPAVPFRFTQRPEKVATYKDVLRVIDAPDGLVLDTRSRLEFTGEDVRAARGGAIPGAAHVEWLNNLTAEGGMKSAEELRCQFEAAGVTPDKEIIAYCQTGYRSAHAYTALRLLGYERVRNYLGSWREWGDKTHLPIETRAAAPS
jgi:thiosulfate/3-mercaptopyruvate sulfurtransferase